MFMRLLGASLVAVLLVGGCGDDDSIDLESLADSSTDDTSTASDDTAAEPQSEPAESDSAADDATEDTDGSDDSQDSKQPLDTEAKQGGETLSAFFEGNVSSDTEQCMIEALLADTDLLQAVVAVGPDGDLSDLEESDQVAAVEAGLSCVTTEELQVWIQASIGAGVEEDAFAADASTCISERLTDDSNPDRSSLMLGLVALSEHPPPTSDQVDLIVALMVECVDANLLIDAIVESAVDDPALEDAVDRSCIDEAIGDESYLDALWRLVVENPDAEFEQLAPEQQAAVVEPIFSCVSFGTVIATAAAEDGVELSSDTVACIDDAIDGESLLEAFLYGGEFDQSEFVGQVLPCLSAEELAGLGG